MAGFRRRAIVALRKVGQVARRFGPAPFILLIAALLPAPSLGATHVLGVPSLCVFHNLTGLPCPGCGITRSLICCAHGHWADAFTFHPLGPIAFITLISATLTRVPRLERLRLPTAWVGPLSWVSLAVVLLVWAIRLLGWLPAPP